MTAIFKILNEQSIHQEIQSHPTWLGYVSGLKAEKLLRGTHKPFFYVWRAGEHTESYTTDYYVTYKDRDGSIRHQPVVITTSQKGWYFENGGGMGPFSNDVSIDNVIHFIMHCKEEECTPFVNFVTK
jgi:hypothetical protein